MHEVALAQGIVDIVESQAQAQAFRHVRRIHLSIGALAQVEPDALVFGFDSVSRGTVAAGAELRIERPAGQGSCMGCGSAVTLQQRGDACPSCASFQILVTGGEELRVVDLEVD
jgi:hydrogenase nickel incorporation protein HypA/HybF